MKTGIAKRFFCLLLAALLGLAALAPAALASSADEATLERIRTLPAFIFRIHEDGIAQSTVPLYTAPSEDSYRAGGGKAAVNTKRKVSEANYVGGWLLVRYENSEGKWRVGYIQRQHLNNFQSTMPDLNFDRIPVIAANTIYVTDDPVLGWENIGTLEAGEPFLLLAKYTYNGDWWYIECEVDGQIARGFIDRNRSRFFLGERSGEEEEAEVYSLVNLGSPSVSPRGTSRIGSFRLNAGERKPVREKPDPKATQITSVYPNKEYVCYDTGKAEGSGHLWYYIWCEEDSKWGWISSSNGTLMED